MPLVFGRTLEEQQAANLGINQFVANALLANRGANLREDEFNQEQANRAAIIGFNNQQAREAQALAAFQAALGARQSEAALGLHREQAAESVRHNKASEELQRLQNARIAGDSGLRNVAEGLVSPEEAAAGYGFTPNQAALAYSLRDRGIKEEAQTLSSRQILAGELEKQLRQLALSYESAQQSVDSADQRLAYLKTAAALEAQSPEQIKAAESAILAEKKKAEKQKTLLEKRWGASPVQTFADQIANRYEDLAVDPGDLSVRFIPQALKFIPQVEEPIVKRLSKEKNPDEAAINKAIEDAVRGGVPRDRATETITKHFAGRRKPKASASDESTGTSSMVTAFMSALSEAFARGMEAEQAKRNDERRLVEMQFASIPRH